MKVGTDAILLGTWAGLHAGKVRTILDVGTGTGVVALMMAQRFPEADVTAIDVEEDAVDEAAGNFRNSPWSDRCRAALCPVQQFEGGPFDLIVSNPPWFHDGLKPPTTARAAARHNESLSIEELARSAARLLHPQGLFAVVIPTDSEIYSNADRQELHCHRRAVVRPTPESQPKRQLLEFGLSEPDSCIVSEFAVEAQRHQYTQEYAAMTQDFLLRASQFV